MPRARIDPGRYARRSFAQVLSGPSKSGAGTLVAGVLELFPRADPERLQNWVEGMHRWPGAETDAVLFLALVSGTRFRIYRPRVEELQEELWSWLTWHPRNMRAGLAEILVSALTPELRRELKAREGWRLGPAGSRGKKLGTPPASRGAWAAALVVEQYLRWSDVPAAEAVNLALDLAALLTTREIADPSELRGASKRTGILDAYAMVGELLDRYEWWVAHDAVQSNDPAPLQCQQGLYATWRTHHQALAVVLARYGAQTLAELTLKEIPEALWRAQPAEKPTVPKRARKGPPQVKAAARLGSRKRRVPK